jgi:hypothetical protein
MLLRAADWIWRGERRRCLWVWVLVSPLGKWAVIPEKAAQYPLVTTAREVGPARSPGQLISPAPVF